MYNFALLLFFLFVVFVLPCLFLFLGQLFTADYIFAHGFQCRIFSQSKRRNLQYPKVLKETRLQLQLFVMVKTILDGHLVPRILSALLQSKR